MQQYCHVYVTLLLFLLCWGSVARAALGLMILDNPIRLPFSGFGASLTVVGDVDSDGVVDYLVGAYDQRWNKNEHQGRAFVFSGRTGKLLYALDHPSPQEYAAFGFSVATLGDINADNVPDILIGAFGQGEGGSGQALLFGGTGPVEEDTVKASAGSGQAFVFSGKDGQFLYSLQAPQQQTGAGFGWAVAALGDVTGDGVSDLVASAFGHNGEGRVFVFSGQNGTLLHTLAPSLPGTSAFGWSVAGAGDLNADGVPDVLVGAPYSTVGSTPVQGRVYAFSGRDGSVLYALDNPQPQAGAAFGWRVTSSGDVNKDGVPDILVGAPYQNDGPNKAQGAAFVFSGVDGILLFPLHNPAPTKRYASFGWTVEKGPDVNHDGVPELLVGAPYQTVDEFHVQGEVFLFNGQDGRHLITFDNPYPHQGSLFGYAVASPGDINGDGIPEFAVGASGQSILDKAAVGRVFIFLSQP